MEHLSIITFIQVSLIYTLFLAAILLNYFFVKNKLNKTRFFRFLSVFFIGMTCSLIPFGIFSAFVGFPAVLLSSILVSCVLDRG